MLSVLHHLLEHPGPHCRILGGHGIPRRGVLTDWLGSTLNHLRSSISSYRAEAAFLKTLAGSESLKTIVPRCYWVHVDDRRGVESGAACDSQAGPGARDEDPPAGQATGEADAVAEGAIIDALRESSFMMITGEGGVAHEKLSVGGLADRARLTPGYLRDSRFRCEAHPGIERFPMPPGRRREAGREDTARGAGRDAP